MRISDWSSDVCSSDLAFKVCLRKSRLRYEQACQQRQGQRARHERRGLEKREQRIEPGFSLDLPDTKNSTTPIFALQTNPRVQIGRASCEDRGGQNVEISVDVGSLKKNNRINTTKH